MIKISWNDIVKAVRKIVEILNGFHPDIVIGIGRSGIIPAVLLSKKYRCRLEILDIRKYSDEKPPRKIYRKPVVLKSICGLLKGNILIVDDLVRTGETINTAINIVKILGDNISIKTATIVKKTECKFNIDAYYIETDECPIFPWDLI